ncbi:hypothetical protein A2U01_0056233, partial [Trifolium medium]|nr:hypothetical protein [Trifolium medium]
CNLITALCRRNKVPEEGEDDGGLEPVKGLDYKYYHALISAGPVNNRGDHGGQEGSEEVEEQGMQDVMEEIDRFDESAIPTQPPQGSGSGWAYTHSEHELASLLHNLDINTHFRMPNVYYQTQGTLYSEAMSYRQQFPP